MHLAILCDGVLSACDWRYHQHQPDVSVQIGARRVSCSSERCEH